MDENRRLGGWPPDLGEPYRLPSGELVAAASWRQDHTGRYVNDVQVWAAPAVELPPPAPQLVYPLGTEPPDGR